jgi:prepilin-type N-terminal cleavage/methylation domain-containing protein
MKPTKRAFTLIEVMIVILMISVIFAIAAPNLILARENSRAKNCSQNLKNIEGAKEQYALDRRLTSSTTPAMTDLYAVGNSTSNYLKSLPVCTANGSYNINAISTTPTCSRAVSFAINDKGGRFPHTVDGR